ncbi:hypothetical protein [Mesorhizobium sp. M2C.T.Ca.TU.002.02.1.1]|uniref:hypothetical protein n=1 Tax=Mesorhizobium sp. M2C.T.Ca.TU.002.02.1.1 TaxID=2496788 RepID=UPI0013E3B037|nr:hypothetical protein [Mesorhizobium sp. M2C.T.Ca.TU.002.02.1.1]
MGATSSTFCPRNQINGILPIGRIVREWLEANAYLPAQFELDDESATEGSA